MAILCIECKNKLDYEHDYKCDCQKIKRMTKESLCTCSACEAMEMHDKSLFYRLKVWLNNKFGAK